MKKITFILLPFLLIVFACGKQVIKKPVYDYTKMDKITKSAHEKVEKFLESCYEKQYPVKIPIVTKIDSVAVKKEEKHLDIYLNKFFAYIPLREDNVSSIYDFMKKKLGRKFRKYSFVIYSKELAVEQLIPNYYRSDKVNYDLSRMLREDVRYLPVVRNMNKPWYSSNGLNNRNISLWHSHGWYYEQKLNRWEWQRARLFQTVEDIGPIQFTIPYIIPMLENAGANVFLPRERDFQIHEVIIDNDSSGLNRICKEGINDSLFQWKLGNETGFAIGNPPYEQGDNPFQLGTYLFTESDTTNSTDISWIPTFQESGEYAVYIVYKSLENNVSDAHYAVYHLGGKTEYLVNQQIGGSTWIYLGKYKFQEGFNPENGKVTLSNKSKYLNKIVTADAVRFGGGMGNVSRNGMVSGRPRFVEGARYYLQYSGMPDTLVFSLNEENNDYKDDYQSRGEWVNYLKGAPFGPNKNRKSKGLGIPVDLSLAFHTDAGITKNDTVIGTLLIYSTDGADSTKLFPDKISRLANRDFADILQTQIVQDIRAKYDPKWNRRGLWDSDYSEAYRPNVPSALLELLSHQNFLDVKFFHDPRFRFDVSRSIYKSILKFLATQYQFNYVVQPLPVSHFQATFTNKREVQLKWQPVLDSLEETATPEKYIVYTRINDNGFDNGILVDQPKCKISDLIPRMIYSFKITAVNSGGESFPSEILSVCWQDSLEKPVLIINGFNRVSGPASIESDKFTGFLNFIDSGVPDKYDLGYTGTQFDYNPSSKWLDDDAPGHGASYGNYETKVIPGNTFDFPFVHGKSFQTNGKSFVSVSDEVIMDELIDITEYQIVDLILGEEKETEWPKPIHEPQFQAFPEKLQIQITRFCDVGGNLFLSGAYVGTDLFDDIEHASDIQFGKETLKYFWRTNHAARTGGIFSIDSLFTCPAFEFNTNYHPEIYTVEAPDAIEPAHLNAKTILRYSENNMSAAVTYKGNYKIVAFGFPFETILNQKNRDRVMKAVLNYFNDN